MSFLARLLDKVVPFGVGQRTAIFSVANAILLAIGAFGVHIPPQVTTGIAGAAAVFGVAHMTRANT
jgi:hypothetical protein